EVIGVVVHVVAVVGLGGAAVPPPVVSDPAEPCVRHRLELAVPGVGVERPTVAEDDRGTRTPVLVEDLDAVRGRDDRHDVLLRERWWSVGADAQAACRCVLSSRRPAWASAHSRAWSAISSQPSWAVMRCARPGQVSCSVTVPGARYLRALDRWTDGGMMWSSEAERKSSGGRAALR